MMQCAARRRRLEAGVQHPRRVEQARLGPGEGRLEPAARALHGERGRGERPARAEAAPERQQAARGARRVQLAGQQLADDVGDGAEAAELGEEGRGVGGVEALDRALGVARGDDRVPVAVRDAGGTSVLT